MVRIVVYFDEQPVSSGGNRSARHRRYFVATSGAVGRIGKHRKVGKFFDNRNGGDIERIARIGFECPNAAFAENYVVIASGEDVFRAHQKFFHGGGHAALEKNWFADFAEGEKEIVVLHVARADLEDVHV